MIATNRPPDSDGRRQGSTVPDREDIYHGVDFSGSRRHRQKTWVSSWSGGTDAVTVNGFSHAGLVRTIVESSAERRRHHWLIDAPFGLPAKLLEDHGIELSWTAAAAWLASFESAREWRRACRRVSRKEPRRNVDMRFHTPLAPTNLRIFRQTWHCIVSVLAPLSETAAVAVLPFAPATGDALAGPGGARVGEGCPASTLRERGWPYRGYKGTTEKNRQERRRLLDLLTREGGVPVAPEARRRALDDTEGDALDSLILLFSARRFAHGETTPFVAVDDRERVEGWVYV